MSSARKLQEAEFFIELLNALEERGEALTHADDPDAEASFLYAAILNSFYSAVQIMRTEGIDITNFTRKHPEIYSNGSKGGERGKTVHVSHTESEFCGYETPHADNVNFVFRKPPRLAPLAQRESGRVDFKFKGGYYFHIKIRGRNVHARGFCATHLAALREFHAST